MVSVVAVVVLVLVLVLVLVARLDPHPARPTIAAASTAYLRIA
jgi:hypothetical protein